MLVLLLEGIHHIWKHGPGGQGCRIIPCIPWTAASLRALWGRRPHQIHPWVPAAQDQDWPTESPAMRVLAFQPHSPTQLPTIPAAWCSFRRAPRTEPVASISCRWESPSPAQAGHRGLGQQVDGKESIPIRKDVKLPHCLPLTQPTRVAARTQQCSGQIPRPPHMPQVLWVQQPTGLQKAPSPGETDVPADPSICP